MRKFGFLLMLIVLSTNLSNASSITDSLKLIKLEEKVDKLTTSNQQLQLKVEQLIKDKDRLSTIGITAGGLSVLGLLYMGYLYLWGLRKKAESTINEIAPLKLNEIAPNIITSKMNEHPFIKAHNESLAIKKKPIVILGAEDKDMKFHTFLASKGFENLKSRKIDNFENISTDEFEVIFFNNENGALTQFQMNKVITKHKNGFDYFYFNTTRQRFEADGITISFANSRETIENRLFELLKK